MSTANGFTPAVIVQRWFSLSALMDSFRFMRHDDAARQALRRGDPVPLPPMSPKARAAGAFALILPTRKGFLWLLSFTQWAAETEAAAAGRATALAAPGGEMEGREMAVVALPFTSPKGGAA